MNVDKELKYYICLFKKEGHQTWRIITEGDMNIIEKNLSLMKTTSRKFFEVDRLTGLMEEF